jgi:hypothetical protein
MELMGRARMKNKTRMLWVVFTVFFGSISMSAKSKVLAGYIQKIDRVCVALLNSQEKGTAFLASAKTRLEAGFQERGIQSSVLIYDDAQPMEAGQAPTANSLVRASRRFIHADPRFTQTLLKEKAGFDPAYLLQISPGIKVHLYGRSMFSRRNQLHFQLALTEVPSGLVVFKADLVISESDFTEGSSERFTKQVLRMFTSEGYVNASAK